MSKLTAALSLSLLLVAINALATLAQGLPRAVLDTAGRPLRTGTQYYIIRRSAPGINGPGLTLVRPNGSCPLYVGLQGKTIGSSNGLPVTFLPFVSDETVIRESSDFSVSFVASTTTCPESTTDWAIDQASDPNMSGRTLITTRRENQPSDFFRILRDGRETYKLHYCPTEACPQCRFRCGDIGLSPNEGNLLAVHVPALPVVFVRA